MNRQLCQCNPPPHRSLSALRERSGCFSRGKKNLHYSASWISLRKHCKRRSNCPMRFDRVSSCFDTLKAQSSIARLVREPWFDPRITIKPASLFLNTDLPRFSRPPSLQPGSPSDVPRLGNRVIARTRCRYMIGFRRVGRSRVLARTPRQPGWSTKLALLNLKLLVPDQFQHPEK